jgi:6-phosphogluconolactonase (cycloisomerase 2 family)
MRTLRRAIVLSGILAALCAPLAAQSSRPIYLFALDGSGANNAPLHVFSVSPSTGALSEVPGSPFAVGPNPCCIAVDPTGRFVYVANSNSNDISAFSVNASTGALSPLPGAPYLTGVNPSLMAMDPTGRILYVYSFTVTNPLLYAYSIDSGTGVLTSLPNSPFTAPSFAQEITFDPKGNYVFFPQGQNGPILVDTFDFVSGQLTPFGSFPITTANQVFETFVDPSGKFLYATDDARNPTDEVDAFTISPDSGSLTKISGSPYPVGIQPFGIATDPTGKFLYIANYNGPYQTNRSPSQYDGSISAFTIDPESGALTPVSGSPFAAGINSLSVIIDPTGHFAYAFSATYTTGYLSYATILTYAVDQSTGALTPLPGSTWTDSIQYTLGFLLAISYGPGGAQNPAPMISSVLPSSVTAGSAGFTLQVNGVNFVPGASVYFGGQARATTFVSSTQLNAQIFASDILAGGTGVVFVFNPLPGGGASTSVELSVFNPTPVLSSISPTSAVAGAAGFTLTLNGSNFVGNSTVNFGSASVTTAYVNSTQLTATIPAGLVMSQGTDSVTVANPATSGTGGGTSDPVTFTILPASVQPTVGTLVPASATAGGPGFTLTVTGSGFTPASVVSFNLNNETTHFISATEVQADIPASAIAVAGDPVVIVTIPGVGISQLATFVVNNPPPAGGMVSPPSLPAGNAALTLNVSGANFTQGSAVLVNGSSRATLFVSSMQLQATLLPSDLSHGGTLNITVSTPPPGGGTTTTMSFTVADYAVSGSNTPTSASAGYPANFSLTVSPSNGPFSNPVTFSASGLPTGAMASFSPLPTIIPGSTATPVTLSISVTARSFVPPTDSPRGPGAGWPSLYLVVAMLGMMALGMRKLTSRARQLAPQFLLALLLVMAAGLVGCGGGMGGSSSPQQINPGTGTPAGTYPILVSATSGGVVHTTTVTLKVQ